MYRIQAGNRAHGSISGFSVAKAGRRPPPKGGPPREQIFTQRVTAMPIADRIEKDYIEAYKSGDKVKLATLRLVKTAAKNRQVELLRPLTDDDYMDVLVKQAKQRQDSIEQYLAAKRQDLADTENAELDVLRGYLPQTLSQEELDAAIEAAVAPLLGEGMKAMGRAIQAIMTEYKGRVDGKAVSDAVKARFQRA